MAVILPAAVADRLIKLLGMRGSVHDGEALTAARMADRLVRHQLKLTWGEVVQPSPTGASSPEPPRVWHEPGTWQEAARLAAQWPECLTEWEQDFLVSVVRYPRVSEKQLAILNRLVRKARGTAGVREPADSTTWYPPAEPSPTPNPPEAEPADQPASTKKRPRRRRKRQS